MDGTSAVFVDTWGWLAFGHRDDAHHAVVSALIRELRRGDVPIFTTDYVLNELITLLFRREAFVSATNFIEAVLASAARGQLLIERATPDRFAAAWALRKRFADKPSISFTDLMSMVIMKERGLNSILTQDGHFAHVGMGFTRLPET